MCFIVVSHNKYLLITGLKELKRVVATTGEGTADSPQLMKADVGFGLEIGGTKAAN